MSQLNFKSITAFFLGFVIFLGIKFIWVDEKPINEYLLTILALSMIFAFFMLLVYALGKRKKQSNS